MSITIETATTRIKELEAGIADRDRIIAVLRSQDAIRCAAALDALQALDKLKRSISTMRGVLPPEFADCG